jgi:hypothetical protein
VGRVTGDDAQSQARIAVALKLLGTIRGGAMPSPDEMAGGLTREERDQAEWLFAQDLQMSAPMDLERVERLCYLIKHAPGALTIDEAITSLSLEQLTEFNALWEADDGDC